MSGPVLLPGRPVELAGRGTTFVRDSGGDMPPLLLLHGWAVTADANFFTAYAHLAESFRVLALDHRGHGRGIRPDDGVVRLSACADDAAALLVAVGVGPATVLGYSMGGAVAQLLWRRHPDRVSGLVLASTARHFQAGPLADVLYRSYTPLAHLAHRADGPARSLVQRRVDRRVTDEDHRWMRSELASASPAGLLSSMRSLGRFRSNEWIGGIDVPTSVVVTTEDRTIPAAAQHRLADAIPNAHRFEVDGPHDAIVTRTDRYLPVLDEALARVRPLLSGDDAVQP